MVCLSTTFLVITTMERSTSSSNNNAEARGNTSTQREKIMTFMRIINRAVYTLVEKKETEREKEE